MGKTWINRELKRALSRRCSRPRESAAAERQIVGVLIVRWQRTRAQGAQKTSKGTDLDGDGRLDAVVLLSSSDWCGSGGCSMLVFRGMEDGFTFVSSSTVTSEPIRVSTERTFGWKTLIVYSKGKGDVVMRFDGTRYPLNPSTQQKASAAQVSTAETVMK
jgi:hypothetical protein